jgi:hypothetical protein
MALFGGLFGGNDVPQGPPPINVQGTGPTQGNVLGGIQGLGQYNTYDIPGAQQYTHQLLNNPGTAGYLQGAGQAGQMGMQAGGNAFGAGGQLYGMGNQVFNTAFDPQSALYARTQQQLQDQTRASQAARGIQSSPYGAGVENKAMSDFNIDWQNQQLQRQLQGLQGAGNAFGQGAGLQGQGVGMYQQGSALPYMANQQVGQGQMAALSGLGQFGQAASTLPQTQIADWQNYLNYGNQAAAANNQNYANQLQANQQQWNQNTAMWRGLGQLGGAAIGGMVGGPMGVQMGSQLFGGATNNFMGGGSFNPPR